MDNEGHKKMHSTSGGHESHGVLLCNKCGWPFPNPHPSAKQRRNHKKVCGTIGGYKLKDPSVSDDDLLSDDDRKTPSPKLARESDSNKRRSEDEVFSDAVMEFPDGGFSAGTEEIPNNAAADVEKSGEKDLTVFYSFNDKAVAGINDPSINSTGSSQMQNAEVPRIETDLQGSNLESQVQVSSSTKESAAILTGDKSLLACDFQYVALETLMHASQDNKVINAGNYVGDGLMRYAGQETDTKRNDEINSVSNVVPFSPYEYPGQTSEAEFKSQEIEKMNSDLKPATEVVLLKEEHGAKMASKMSLGATVEPAELSDASDIAQNKLGDEQALDFPSSVNSLGDFSGKGEWNENVHKLSLPADIPVADHAETMLEDFKDYKRVKLHKSATLDSCEITNHKKDDIEDTVSLKDHASAQTIELSEVSQESASDKVSMPVVESPSAEGERGEPQIKLSSNEGILVERINPVRSVEKLQPSDVSDKSLHMGVHETAVKVLYDVNPMVAPSGTNTIGLHDAGNNENSTTEMCDVVGKVEIERVEEDDYVKSIVTTSRSATNPAEFHLTTEFSLHKSDDVCDHEKGKIENCDVVGVESKEEPQEEKLQLETKTAFGSNSNRHETQAAAEDVKDVSVMNLPEKKLANSKEVSYTQDVPKQSEVKGNDKAQGECDVEHFRNIDSLERTSEDHAMKAPGLLVLDTESSMPLVAEDAMDVSVMNLPETKSTNLNEATDTQDVSKQPEVKGNDKAQGECTVEHGRNVDSLERNSEQHATKPPFLLPSDTEYSMQGSFVGDKYAREHDTGRPVINQSSQGENDNNFGKHQFGVSVVDVPVDSSSQTDSLECNWGSVSVLSTQSDIPAGDTEMSPPTLEANKLNLKKPEGTIERENSEKSNIFEAPSFLTLVEPGGGSDQKAAASDIETVKNLEQQKASSQAGWFPSLTNVVNESQGRKKNEEIIAKVTNWSTGKQHNSLKNLLGEANVETKPNSPKPKENKAPIQMDEPVAKEKNVLVTTVSSILGSEVPADESAKIDTGIELNSPARYPTDIKRERRKVKGRPYWAQFVCCSSVN